VRRMSARDRALVVCAATVWVGLAACGSSGGPAPAAPAAAPPQLAVPAGQHVVLTAAVERGSQVYACRGGTWTLERPAAVLTGSGTDVLHDAGPRWTATLDGSSVAGAQVAAVPVAGSASDLLLRATSHAGAGVMSTVDYVQRLGVRGGAAPTGACSENTEQAVGYTAEYRFYAPGQ
jgi:hypothetical protein